MIVRINDKQGNPLFEVRPDTGGACWSVWKLCTESVGGAHKGHRYMSPRWRRLAPYPKTVQDALLVVAQQYVISDDQRRELKDTARSIEKMLSAFSVSVTT
ncbi:MAG: hypothetical protein FWD65_04395 [Coriobacteriia bacterium]|nr:hypothetical protein [Coriobacteriia bacterium]